MQWETERREEGRGKGEGATLPFPMALARAVRLIVGAPDYAAYIEHCQRAGHPPRLSEREYVSEFFEQKGRAARCC